MKKLQKGFSIVTAIFLLVVLAGLGAAMVTLSTSQNQSSAMDIMGSRAYQAARAGMEWAAYQIINNPTPTTAAICNQSFAQGALLGTLSPFAVNVTCTTSSSAVTGDSQINYIYIVTAVACTTATCPGTPTDANYVERSVTSKFGR
jgi:MSHA biogenesis protein MshP